MDNISVYFCLTKELVLQKDLRIAMETYCTQLLSDQKLFVGRVDGRYTGPAVAGSLEDGVADPSAITNAAYVEAVRDLYTRKPGLQTDVK